MSDEAINHLNVLVEHVLDQNRAVLEAVSDIRTTVKNLPTRDEFEELKQDVQIIKAAVTATNHDLAVLEHRVSRLEAA